MLFIIHGVDKPDHVDVRKSNMEDHVQYVKNQKQKLHMAGPMLMDDGETPCGTVLVIDAENRAEAEQFANNDPYAKAGLFKEIQIHAWKKTVGWDD